MYQMVSNWSIAQQIINIASAVVCISILAAHGLIKFIEEITIDSEKEVKK